MHQVWANGKMRACSLGLVGLGFKLHSDCAIVSIVSLRSEVEHVDFSESIRTAPA